MAKSTLLPLRLSVDASISCVVPWHHTLRISWHQVCLRKLCQQCGSQLDFVNFALPKQRTQKNVDGFKMNNMDFPFRKGHLLVL